VFGDLHGQLPDMLAFFRCVSCAEHAQQLLFFAAPVLL
jgi:hypothetical protein